MSAVEVCNFGILAMVQLANRNIEGQMLLCRQGMNVNIQGVSLLGSEKYLLVLTCAGCSLGKTGKCRGCAAEMSVPGENTVSAMNMRLGHLQK